MKNYEKMFTFFLSNKVNTETAEYKSRSFKLFMYINKSIIKCNQEDARRLKKCKMTIKLPIHLRYHAPNESSNQKPKEYTEVSLKKPNIFINNCSVHLNQNHYFDLDNIGNSNQNFDSEYSEYEELNYSYFNRTIKLPCEKNASVPNDYLIYISNFNKKSDDLQYQLNKNQINYMNFYEKICSFNELSFKKVRQFLFLKLKKKYLLLYMFYVDV